MTACFGGIHRRDILQPDRLDPEEQPAASCTAQIIPPVAPLAPESVTDDLSRQYAPGANRQAVPPRRRLARQKATIEIDRTRQRHQTSEGNTLKGSTLAQRTRMRSQVTTGRPPIDRGAPPLHSQRQKAVLSARRPGKTLDSQTKGASRTRVRSAAPRESRTIDRGQKLHTQGNHDPTCCTINPGLVAQITLTTMIYFARLVTSQKKTAGAITNTRLRWVNVVENTSGSPKHMNSLLR